VTMVVGFARDKSGTAVLHLAGLLARSAGDHLVVCTVVTTTWPPHPPQVDAEYHAYLDRLAEQSLTEARARLPADVDATFLVHHAGSAPAGLLEVAEQHDASLIVLGSSSRGVLGHVTLGSVTDRIAHSSHIPVAIAPRGYRCGAGAKVVRVTTAFGGSGELSDLVLATASVAARVGASLRVASFAVRPATPFAGAWVGEADDLVLNEWIKDTVAAIRKELDSVRALPQVPHQPLEVVVGSGYSWGEALEDVPWTEGDVLAVGSSTTGPVARVFLGSRAAKILRHSPVPVVLVPRCAVRELVPEP
jgi:nucleotide-binding universal stress UspA family protein